MAYTNIDRPDLYFNTKLYTGNGSTQSITGVGFQPDWVWLKDRTNANSGRINDSVRGATKYLIPSTNGAEATESAGLTSFDSDGFSLGSNSDFNGSSANFVSWNWLAGGTASSNTDGDITSTVSVNQTSGFSIVKWNTGGQPSSTTVSIGHGLNAVPKFFIVKNLPSADNWYVYHNSLGNTKSIIINSTNAEFTNADIWGSTTPTSSVFSINTAEWGVSTNDKITYCFAEKKGYSKFGSYTGNGNADGTFVYTGFKPAWVMAKKSNSTGNWVIVDTKRDGYNGANDTLQANVTDVESGGNRFDIVSNGFKARSTSAYSNSSGDTFIYMAFAESPFVTGASGIPTTAR